jgi:hypothetical protein
VALAGYLDLKTARDPPIALVRNRCRNPMRDRVRLSGSRPGRFGVAKSIKYGRPWSHTSVLTVLRDRTYLGEVYFRATHHRAPHRPLGFEAGTLPESACAQRLRVLGARAAELPQRRAELADSLDAAPRAPT